MKHFFCFFILLFWKNPDGTLLAQPSRDWDKTLGGINWDEFHVMLPTPDGGFLLGGNVTGGGGEVSGPLFGGNDYWLVKVDANGQKIWDKVYGGSGDDRLWAILPLPGGEFLLGGASGSGVSGNKTTENQGDQDFWLLKVAASGEILWDKTIGGPGRDELFSLRAVSDGSWLLGGWSSSGIGGDKTSEALGVFDMWVLRIAPTGDILWQQTFGGPEFENLYDMAETPDGGFLLGGASASNKSATKSEDSRGQSDFWVIKIDEDGNLLWDRRFGGSNVEQLEQILPLQDGNFLLLGASLSTPGGDHSAPNYGSFDFWAVKITPGGEKIWDKTFGGSGFDGAFNGLETRSGHLLIGGVSDSPANSTKKSPNLGGYDYWLVHLDAAGNLVWDKTYGGSKDDSMTDFLQTKNGSLLLAGHSGLNASAFKSENARGHNDVWLLKTWCDVRGELPEDRAFCSGQTIELAVFPENCATGDCEVYWSNGLRGEKTSLLTDTSGTLWFFAEDRNACLADDSLNFEILPAPSVDLGPDTTIFRENSQLVLDVFQPNTTFEWNTGATEATLTISETGTYAVTATADNGCTATDEIALCACAERLLYIPNVLQPDGDIYNDTWYIFSKPGAVEELERIEIFDNWGHRIFRAEHAQPNSKLFGWDGTSFGKRCLPGVYTYAIRVRYGPGKGQSIYGTVTLVR